MSALKTVKYTPLRSLAHKLYNYLQNSRLEMIPRLRKSDSPNIQIHDKKTDELIYTDVSLKKTNVAQKA